MLTMELAVEISVLAKQGKSIRAISRELGLSRTTVRRYLRKQIIEPKYSQRPKRASKLDPFKTYIGERIAAAKPEWIPAAVLYREILERGYTGKESLVRQYVAKFKSTKVVEPDNRFETPAGKQVQVDFTTINCGKHRLKAFVATLGFSRASYVRFSLTEKQDDWLAGLEEAFIYFGGVPQEVLFDNAKCIMLERDAYGVGRHRWNTKLLALAADYGFTPKACRPYRARTKGKVERFNHYLKNSFIVPLKAEYKVLGLSLDVTGANARVGAWLHDVAHQRTHAATNEKPQTRLEQERFAMQPLPFNSASHSSQVLHDELSMTVPPNSFQHNLAVYDSLLEVSL